MLKIKMECMEQDFKTTTAAELIVYKHNTILCGAVGNTALSRIPGLILSSDYYLCMLIPYEHVHVCSLVSSHIPIICVSVSELGRLIAPRCECVCMVPCC